MTDKSDPKDSGLVPTANKALTTRSSALVRRGLAALGAQPASDIDNINRDSEDRYLASPVSLESQLQGLRDLDELGLGEFHKTNWALARQNWESALAEYSTLDGRIGKNPVAAGWNLRDVTEVREAIPRITFTIALTYYHESDLDKYIEKLKYLNSLYPEYKRNEVETQIAAGKVVLEEVLEICEAANRAYNEKMWSDARAGYNNALRIVKEYGIFSGWIPEALRAIAFTHWNEGDLDIAREVFVQIRRDYPDYKQEEIQGLISQLPPTTKLQTPHQTWSEKERTFLVRLLPALHSLEEVKGLLRYFQASGVDPEKIYEEARQGARPDLPSYQDLLRQK